MCGFEEFLFFIFVNTSFRLNVSFVCYALSDAFDCAYIFQLDAVVACRRVSGYEKNFCSNPSGQAVYAHSSPRTAVQRMSMRSRQFPLSLSLTHTHIHTHVRSHSLCDAILPFLALTCKNENEISSGSFSPVPVSQQAT